MSRRLIDPSYLSSCSQGAGGASVGLRLGFSGYECGKRLSSTFECGVNRRSFFPLEHLWPTFSNTRETVCYWRRQQGLERERSNHEPIKHPSMPTHPNRSSPHTHRRLATRLRDPRNLSGLLVYSNRPSIVHIPRTRSPCFRHPVSDTCPLLRSTHVCLWLSRIRVQDEAIEEGGVQDAME
jgi:hypothetical protein